MLDPIPCAESCQCKEPGCGRAHHIPMDETDAQDLRVLGLQGHQDAWTRHEQLSSFSWLVTISIGDYFSGLATG